MTKETTQTQLKITDLTRRQIRYICFRLQTQAEEGGPVASDNESGPMSLAGEIKKHMESQDDFGEWKMFAKTWDVDEKSPLVVVKRTSSIYTNWNNILKKGAKDLPVPPQTTKIIELPEVASAEVLPPHRSTPLRGPGGKFVSKKIKETQTLLPPKPVISSTVEIPATTPPANEETPLPAKPEKKSFWDRLA